MPPSHYTHISLYQMHMHTQFLVTCTHSLLSHAHTLSCHMHTQSLVTCAHNFLSHAHTISCHMRTQSLVTCAHNLLSHAHTISCHMYMQSLMHVTRDCVAAGQSICISARSCTYANALALQLSHATLHVDDMIMTCCTMLALLYHIKAPLTTW